MALAKELTEHSLPEIGDAFAGRDHTTVLHACRQIKHLLETDGKLREDGDKMIRKLSEKVGDDRRGKDRKSVVEGRSVAESIDLGGCRTIKKKRQREVKQQD